MNAARLRTAFAAFLIVLVATLVAASPALDTLRGLSIDILTALRWRVFGNAFPPERSPAVVVGSTRRPSTRRRSKGRRASPGRRKSHRC